MDEKTNAQPIDEKTSALTQNFSTGKLFRYVMPTILAVLLASLYSIVDGIFVSNFGGTTAFAAINQVSPIFMIIAAIGFMFGTGGSALVGKILGEGDEKRAKGLFSFFAYALIAIGVIASIILWFTIEPILKALGVTETMLRSADRRSCATAKTPRCFSPERSGSMPKKRSNSSPRRGSTAVW